MKRVRLTAVAAGIFLSACVFSMPAFAATLSGGSYTLNGEPTAISSAETSGGTYSEQSTADPASGNSSGGVYATTPAPAAPAAESTTTQNQNNGSQNNTTTTPPVLSGGTGGVSGQIVMEQLPSSGTGNGTGVVSADGANGASSGAGGAGSILLTNVRLVRGTPTSITIYFTTSIPAIGSVRYSPYAGEVTTLNDSTARTDHVFTVTNLTPVFVYQFQLAAVSGTGAISNVYQVIASPDEIGQEGTSVRPLLVPYHAFAETAPVGVGSSTKSSSILHPLPPYIYELLVLIVAIIIGIVWVRSRRSL